MLRPLLKKCVVPNPLLMAHTDHALPDTYCPVLRRESVASSALFIIRCDLELVVGNVSLV